MSNFSKFELAGVQNREASQDRVLEGSRAVSFWEKSCTRSSVAVVGAVAVAKILDLRSVDMSGRADILCRVVFCGETPSHR